VSESYRDIVAWQKGMALVTSVYKASQVFPEREIFGLTRQLRKAVLSVPSNIAEGKGRDTKRDYLQFLYRARGSIYETQTQLEVARNLGFLSDETYAPLCDEAAQAGKVLNGLIRNVKSQIESPNS
jgi:four helix bundle protein